MYRLEETVFIAWGGNQSLAEKVAQRLRMSNIQATVGGNAEARQDAEEHLGTRIVSQMRTAARAIILAEGKSTAGGQFVFRPNLMFEWGYLLGRLPRGSIVVNLINTPREVVPTDLQGIFSELVPANCDTDSKRAKWIVRKFLASRLSAKFNPFDVAYNWTRVKIFLDSQLSGESPPNPDLLCRQLVASVIPAMYLNDLGFLDGIVRKLGTDSDNAKSPYLILTLGMLRYVEAVRSQPPGGTFNDLKRSFSNCCNSQDPFVRAVSRLYMSECLVKEAFLSQSEKDKMRLLFHARQNQMFADLDFERTGYDEDSLVLWMYYVYRSIGRTLESLGDMEQGAENMLKALDFGEKALVYLQSHSDTSLSRSIEAEYYLSVIDYVRMSRNIQFDPFRNIGNLSITATDKAGPLWAKAFNGYRAFCESNCPHLSTHS